MRPNVLEHEPGIALFVPDEDPLVFYRAIASVADRVLSGSGCGIVEINEVLGLQVEAEFRGSGCKETEIVKDYFSKDRFVKFSSSL